MATTLSRFSKLILFATRTLATRKDGPFRKIPKMPITGPHDYENWKRLQRSRKRKVWPRSNKLKKEKHKDRKPKKKRDDPIKEVE